MKRIGELVVLSILIFILSGCGGNEAMDDSYETSSEKNVSNQTGENLVVYFSHSGNTKKLAEEIAQKTDSDLFEIVPIEEYPTDYDEVVDLAQVEKNSKVRPKLKSKIENIESYDTIYIGYPIWWSDMPMIIYSFLDEYDIENKTIIPFCTHGGSGLSDTDKTINDLESNAEVKEGLAIRDSEVDSSENDIVDWLNN
ncbi:flavodoxin [Enterococcus faecalis]|nr:NAD(P)H-dependent oxidoreductase [Enterococcus faecalis]